MKKFLISLGLATFLISGTVFANTTTNKNTAKIQLTETQKNKIKTLTTQLKPYENEFKNIPRLQKAKDPSRRLARLAVLKPNVVAKLNLSQNVKNILAK